MRIQLRMLIAMITFIASATAAAADTATTVAPSGSAQSSRPAVWTTRKLHAFGVQDVGSSLGPAGRYGGGSLSCDELEGELRFLLLRLGARASDLHVDERGCRKELTLIDATFSVLVRADKTGQNAAGALAEARWQTVELATGFANAPDTLVRSQVPRFSPAGTAIRFYRTCGYLEYVTKKVLPLFPVRDVKLISNAVCDKTGVGLRAQVLEPTEQLAASP
jgi:hypothetical protein